MRWPRNWDREIRDPLALGTDDLIVKPLPGLRVRQVRPGAEAEATGENTVRLSQNYDAKPVNSSPMLHPHDLVAAIDVDDLTGDRRAAVTRQKGRGGAEFVRDEIPFERSVQFVMLEHLGESGDAASR